MKRSHQIIACIFFIILPGFLAAQAKSDCKWKDEICSDYKNFYSLNNVGKFVLGIGYAGFYANTTFDQEIQGFYNDYIKSRTTDNVSKVVKPFGDGGITIPVYLSAILIGELGKNSIICSTIGEWGERCSRAILVGAPPMLLLQVVLGSSRPEDGKGSHWHPFKDNNGVSGHSFMGSIPFLTAAKMTDKRLLKYSFYLGSTLTGLSRINDNKHYFSQVFLGWWISYLSVNSVNSKQLAITPSFRGIGVVFYF